MKEVQDLTENQEEYMSVELLIGDSNDPVEYDYSWSIIELTQNELTVLMTFDPLEVSADLIPDEVRIEFL